MTAPLSEPPSFPEFRAQQALPVFLLGWGLGTALLFGVRGLADALISDPCRGRTLLALFVPLLLGPGGFALVALHQGHMRRAALGLGLVIASLFPSLYVGALDIGKLRTSGCAGGYLVLSAGGQTTTGQTSAGQTSAGQTSAGQKSVGQIELRPGESRELRGRIGGYTRQTHPGVFELSSQSSAPSIQVTLPTSRVRVGDTFALKVMAAPGTPINTYTVNVVATQGKGVGAPGTLEVSVRP